MTSSRSVFRTVLALLLFVAPTAAEAENPECHAGAECTDEETSLLQTESQMGRSSIDAENRPASDIVTTKKTVKLNAKQLALRAINKKTKMNITAITSGPKAWCKDLPGFVDSDGDDCAKIVSGALCDGAGDYCVNGVCADGACCGCGGGVRSSEDTSKPPCTQLSVATRSGPVGKRGHCLTDTSTRGTQTIAQNKVMFFGDSDIEYWDTETDFPGSVNCGVGGSTAWEAAQWAQKTGELYKPKNFVVMVAGENDVGGGGASNCVSTVLRDYKDAVMGFLDSPNKPTVIYLGTKPEPGSTDYLQWYNKYDALVFELARSPIVEGRLKVVDVHGSFSKMNNVGPDGQTLYDTDDLHMNKNGYSYWTNWVKNIMASCEDVPDWKDSDGDHCATVRKNSHCGNADDYKVNGVGAKEACCACGGGSTAS